MCDNNALANLIMKFASDWRRILNELQRYSVNGAIDIGITNALDDKNYDESLKEQESKLKNEYLQKAYKFLENQLQSQTYSHQILILFSRFSYDLNGFTPCFFIQQTT